MDTKVDMTYRFLWDTEPTDEQLLVIMKKVAEGVLKERAIIAEQMKEKIEIEYARAFAAQQAQQNNRSGKT